jgi:hypothetical protein
MRLFFPAYLFSLSLLYLCCCCGDAEVLRIHAGSLGAWILGLRHSFADFFGEFAMRSILDVFVLPHWTSFNSGMNIETTYC